MITRKHLEDDRSAKKLYEGAVRNGLIPKSEHYRLEYFSAIEHALNTAPGDEAGGLLAWIVMGKKWNYITDEDERLARVRVQRIFYGTHLATEHRKDPVTEDVEEMDRLWKITEAKILATKGLK